MKKNLYKLIIIVAMVSLIFPLGSCNKYLDVPYPINSVTSGTVYGSKATIDQLMNNLYIQAQNTYLNFANLACLPSVADDGYNPTSISFYMDCSSNNVSANTGINTGWGLLYTTIYNANLLIENLPGSTAPGFSDDDKKAYVVAAKTIRAYTYFLLTRSYGDVPLILSTNVPQIAMAPRTSADSVYALIEKDLQEAVNTLPADINGKYTINNKYMPEAMLAEVYLTEGKWSEAETAASDIIESGNYQLAALTDVFLQSSNEGIVTAPPVNCSDPYKMGTSAYGIGFPSGFPETYFEGISPALSQNLLSSFEPGDQRLVTWVTLLNNAGYSDPAFRMFCYKYKYNYIFYGGLVAPGTEEEDKIIRLAEIYLIRSEARAEQNNLSGAAEDLNVIRNRAGLDNTTAASQAMMIDAVLNERRHELFFEGGWRWFDLVRTGQANAVLSVIPYKVNWKPYMVLFPIDQATLSASPNLTQTPGY